MDLQIQNLCKQFFLPGPLILDHLNLSLSNCSTLALIGPSGGGKTTLLRILAGLELPTSGEIHLNQLPLQFLAPQLRLHRQKLGIVFQAFNLFPHLSALDNILLPLLHVHRRPPHEARETAWQWLTRFHLAAHAHKRPSELSGGQRQRIAIVRAVAIQPSLILLDEPTSALDPEMTFEVLETIEELRSEGKEFILITHELGFARSIADQIAIVAEGKIAEIGSPREILQNPTTPIGKRFLEKVKKYEAK